MDPESSLVEDHVTYPPAGQPYYPEQNQPQYGGAQSYPPQETYGSEQSYTTEPPYSGQPYSGSSYPAQPYPAAQYDQGYAQSAPAQQYAQVPSAQQYAQPPAYQASGYPQQTPSFVTPPAPRRGSGGMIALIAGSAVLLLILLTVGGVILLRSGDDEPTPGGTAAAPASSGPASSAPAEAAEYPAQIVLPDNVAGLTKVVGNATLDQVANETAAEVKTAANADSAVAAYYAPGGDLTRIVGLFGATGRIPDPKAELDEALSGEDLVVTGLQSVDPGPLGGYMKCGNTASNGQALTVCGWGDGGSLMMAIFVNRSLTDSASLLRQIRGEVLKRG
jgi:hypothetical protein